VGFPFTATYDAEDRMTSLEYTDSSVVHRTEYRYSGDGFLAVIRKFENSSLVDEIRIVRDGLLAVQERDGSNNVLREYTWGLNLGGGIGGLLNLKQGGQDYAYLYDGKGNVAAVLDGSQAVVAAYRYAPFGKLLAQTGSLTQPFGFSTKRYDAQTGLIYYGHRYYSPTIGRWTTRDPLGEVGGMNLYAFVGNNPVNWVDPWGLKPGDTFKTMEEAVTDALDYIYPKTNVKNVLDQREYGGTIRKRKRIIWNKKKFWFEKIVEYTYSEPVEGGPFRVPIPIKSNSVCIYHSHTNFPGYDSENFSQEDRKISNRNRIPIFVITPSGVMKRHDPYMVLILPGGGIGVQPTSKYVPAIYEHGVPTFKF
jgi:RHS repeat-associated protein